MKLCGTCNAKKPYDAFYKHKSTADGLNNECKCCTKERAKKWSKKNPVRRAQILEKNKSKHRDRYLKRRKEAYRKRSLSGKARLTDSMRSLIYISLKNGNGALRNMDWSVRDLIDHLEKQFLKGMTWDNYGSAWHVDHITPIASFNYSKPTDVEFKQCWCLTNLRPLWAKENLSKNAKIEFLI